MLRSLKGYQCKALLAALVCAGPVLPTAYASELPDNAFDFDSDFIMEEIVVTARKKQESLQKVPVVVSVLSSTVIESQRIEGIKDLGSIVPGLVTARAAAATPGAIYLRGIGTGSGSAFLDQAVAINVDGVGVSSAQLMNAGMFDLKQIEIVRGPQTLFFGKNSPGGVIVVQSEDPSSDSEIEFSQWYETAGEEPGFRGIVSGPLTESLSGRMSMAWSKAGNHRVDVVSQDNFEIGPGSVPVQTAFSTDKDPVETEKIYLKGTLLWESLNDTTAKLKYAFLEDDQEGHSNFFFQRTQCGQGAPQTVYQVPGVDGCRLDDTVISAGLDPLLVASDPNFPGHQGDGFAYNKDELLSLEINTQPKDSLTLTSVSGYYRNEAKRLSEASYQVASGFLNSNTFHLEQLTQELRLASRFDLPVNFTIGAFFEDKKIRDVNAVTGGNNLLSFYGVPGVPTVAAAGSVAIPFGRQNSFQDSTAYALFGQLNWTVNDRWTVTAGARYSYETKKGQITIDTSVPATDIPFLNDDPDWENFSPELTVSFQPASNLTFFGSYRTGFKSGGFDVSYKPQELLTLQGAAIPFDASYDEEEVQGFETGMKSTWLDGLLRLNVALFSYDYEDMQLSRFETGSSGSPSLFVVNAAEASVDGIEIESFWLTPVEGLSVTANLALLKAEYDDYIANCFVGQTIALGCSSNPDPGTGIFTGADMSGESLPNASDWSATLAIDYDFALLSHWNLKLNLTGSYKDDYNPTAALYPDDWQQSGFWWVNASASLYSDNEKYEFFIRAVNLGDKYYSAIGSDAPFSGDAATTGTNDASGLPDLFQFVEGGRQITLGTTFRF